METLKGLFLAALILIGLSACERSFESSPIQLEANSEEPVDVSPGAEVSLPDPRSYVAAPDESIGINQNGKGLAAGTQIESVSVSDLYGAKYALEDAWKEKPALIVFFRGGWCPYCNMQVRELSVYHSKLQEAGVQPVLISVDEPDKSALLGAKYDIPFPVLSDPDLIVHKQFNVVLTLDKNTVDVYKNQYDIDLSAWSGRDHRSFAVASAFVVDKDGVVRVSHAPKDYSQRPSIEQLLKLIDMSSL